MQQPGRRSLANSIRGHLQDTENWASKILEKVAGGDVPPRASLGDVCDELDQVATSKDYLEQCLAAIDSGIPTLPPPPLGLTHSVARYAAKFQDAWHAELGHRARTSTLPSDFSPAAHTRQPQSLRHKKRNLDYSAQDRAMAIVEDNIALLSKGASIL